MAHPNDKSAERVLVLDGYGGLEIWRVHVDALKEQDKNARLFDKRKFDQLKANISQDKRLEGMPLCALRNDRLEIISGHHRVRAARMAGLFIIYVMVDTTELSVAEIKAKQLAHNALVGFDDKKTLGEIYEEIEDQRLQLQTGLDESEISTKEEEEALASPQIDLEFDYKQLTLLFLPANFDEFISTLDLVESAFIGVAQKDEFEKVVKIIQTVAQTESVRNLSAIFLKICEIVKDYYRALASDEKSPFVPKVKLVEGVADDGRERDQT